MKIKTQTHIHKNMTKAEEADFTFAYPSIITQFFHKQNFSTLLQVHH
jgi:hypothetical protein